MAKNTGTFVIDKTVSQEDRDKISERISSDLENLIQEVDARKTVINKRRDFYEGRHERYTNVVGLTNKMQQGHINAVFNYIQKFVQKLHQSLTNAPPKIKIKPKDEADEIETSRAEAVETAVRNILNENKFFSVIFDRCGMTQIRDGDFAIGCQVMEDGKTGKHIEITPIEDLLKLLVWWDDSSGNSFSAIAFSDMWTLTRIKREFGIDAEPYRETEPSGKQGSHLKDQYGMFSNLGVTSGASNGTVTGEVKLSKAKVTDYWGYEVVKGEVKVVNIIFINREMKQFIVTDYEKIPRFIGRSFVNPGRAWSTSFIDGLIDPQVELNDRTSEEGDLIRVGAHMKFLVVNMPDFDADSVKVGSGQCIFIEGEGADFKPLQMPASPFPSEAYLNRVMEHLFNIGLPKIALAAGTAPYTGKVAAIQYQPIVDVVSKLRTQWEIVMEDLVKVIQQYLIDYFPESHAFMREHITDELGNSSDGQPIVREIEFDWDNVLPLSRSDKVVDASTLRDRHAISISTYLEQAGFSDPEAEIKKLKKEAKDPELLTIMEKFLQLSPAALKATLDSQRAQATQAQELQAQSAEAQAAATAANPPTPASTPPILNSSQNQDRRGVGSSSGTPTGQTATPAGAVAQTTQNINAKAGI
jgi:hypothetical protein